MRVAGLGCFLVLAAVAGCGRDHRARFTPAEEVAKHALESGLAAWQNGQPAGPVAGTSPLIHVVDSHRKAGQKLSRFEVLGTAPGDGPRVYAVRLSLDEPREEKRVRFVVVGIDPLWVIRYEDYEMLAHWDHPMDNTGGKKPVTK
jgi:hypothetical protein